MVILTVSSETSATLPISPFTILNIRKGLPGIGDDLDITPLEPLFGILRDLFSVGIKDVISTLDDGDSDF